MYVNVANSNSNINYNLVFVESTSNNQLKIDSNTQIQYDPSSGILTANRIDATYFIGNGHFLTNLTGANVSGEVPYANIANSVAGANVSGIVANANYSAYAGNAFSVNGANVVGNVPEANFAWHVDVEPTTNNFSYHVVLVQNPGDNHLQIDGDDQLQYNPDQGILTSQRVDAQYFVGNGHFLSAIEGSNVTGQVPYANIANFVAGSNVSGIVANANFALNSANANYANFANVSNLANYTANSNNSNLAITVSGNAQPNITSVGNLTNLVVDGTIISNNLTILANSTISNLNVLNLLSVDNELVLNVNSNITSYGIVYFDDATEINLGEVDKISILGGSNGYYLRTDGSGNLSWAAVSNGGSGNTPPAGSNQQIQFNNSGAFGASANLIYDTSTNYLTLIGGLNTNTISATGNIAVGNASLGNLAIANFFQGSGNRLSNLQASNITGTVANASFASNAGYANLAANATYADTANISEYSNIANSANIANFATNANTANTANIANSTPNANFANYANVANFVDTVINAAQPNITSVGTLISLAVSGNVTAANFIGVLANGNSNVRIPSANGNVNISAVGNSNVVVITGTGINVAGTLNSSGNANVANIVSNNATFTLVGGTLTTSAQPNITSVGNLTSLFIDGNLFAENSNIEGNSSLGNLIVENNANIGNVLHIDVGGSLISLGNVNFDDAPDVNLGEIEKITIYGGTNGYYLRTDGSGNLSWAAVTSNGGNAIPSGTNTSVQFNDANLFGGSNAFTFNKTSNTLTVNGHISGNTLGITGNIAVGNATLGTIASAGIFSGSGNQLSNLQAANISGTIANANYAAYAGNITTNAQPNITTVGTLSNLSVSGNISGNNISVSGNSAASNLSITGNVTIGISLTTNTNSNLVTYGNVNLSNSPNITLGNTTNLHISGGINGYFLQTDGAGNLTWAAAGGGGGNASPGGGNRQVQYNDNGTFNGNASFVFDKNTNNVTISGNLISNSLTIGSGIFQFSRSNVYFATTNSTIANQEIYSVTANNLAGIDFVIISDDSSANIRNISKISAVVLGSTVNYNEVNNLTVNGYIGDFQLAYVAGNISVLPQVQLLLTPQSANYMTHKIMITTFNSSV